MPAQSTRREAARTAPGKQSPGSMQARVGNGRWMAPAAAASAAAALGASEGGSASTPYPPAARKAARRSIHVGCTSVTSRYCCSHSSAAGISLIHAVYLAVEPAGTRVTCAPTSTSGGEAARASSEAAAHGALEEEEEEEDAPLAAAPGWGAGAVAEAAAASPGPQAETGRATAPPLASSARSSSSCSSRRRGSIASSESSIASTEPLLASTQRLRPKPAPRARVWPWAAPESTTHAIPSSLSIRAFHSASLDSESSVEQSSNATTCAGKRADNSHRCLA